MISEIRLEDVDGGTLLHATHSHLPEGLSPADNEIGWRLSLEQLKELVEH